MKTKRTLSARYFPTSKKCRIYENNIWVYTTNEDISDNTSNDISYFLSTSFNYSKK